MKRKVLMILISIVAASVFLAGIASAITLVPGEFGIKFTDNTFADLNYIVQSNGEIGAHPQQTVGAETGNVWGIFSMTGIHDLLDNDVENNTLSGAAYYTPGSDGKYYFGVYGGLTVSSTLPLGGDFYLTEVSSGSSYLKVYEVDASDVGVYDLAWAAGANVSGGGAFGTFGSAIINAPSATLWLDCTFSDYTLSYYDTIAETTDLEAIAVTDTQHSKAEAYLDIIGGTGASLFLQGVLPVFTGGAAPYTADLKMISDLTSTTNTQSDGSIVWDNNPWTNNSQDPITGTIGTPIPEPTTITLLGLGLLGCAGLLRRKED